MLKPVSANHGGGIAGQGGGAVPRANPSSSWIITLRRARRRLSTIRTRARSRALDEEGEWKKKTGEADDADIERVRSQVMSADEKRRRTKRSRMKDNEKTSRRVYFY